MIPFIQETEIGSGVKDILIDAPIGWTHQGAIGLAWDQLRLLGNTAKTVTADGKLEHLAATAVAYGTDMTRSAANSVLTAGGGVLKIADGLVGHFPVIKQVKNAALWTLNKTVGAAGRKVGETMKEAALQYGFNQRVAACMK